MNRKLKKILFPVAQFPRKIINYLCREIVREIKQDIDEVNYISNAELKSELQSIRDSLQTSLVNFEKGLQTARNDFYSICQSVFLSVEQYKEQIKENDILPPVFAKYKGKTIVVSPCDPSYCTTCLACFNVCPSHAIEKSQNDEGFYTIKINPEKCIECKKCIAACHVNTPKSVLQRTPKILLATKSLDNNLREKSSSGGLFSEIATTILQQGGIVFGALFDSNLKVHHASINNINDLYKLRGSKYVQSDTGTSFSEVKQALEKGQKVLYSGTPCQIAGLRQFIGIHSNLYTIDIVCHGVPSPLFFEDYKKSLEKQYGKIVNYNFRCKTAEPNSFQPLGWKEYGIRVEFDSNSVLYKTRLEDIYMKGFLQEFTNRPVCHKCPYACGNRVGDITLGDFWGYENTDGNLPDDDKGISALLINSEKGQKLFESIKNKIQYFERDFKILQERNRPLLYPSLINQDRDNFWKDYKEFGFEYACTRWFK